jgi:hypothetical protein
MCTWNWTQFKSQVWRFLSLKRCDTTKTKGFKFGRTWFSNPYSDNCHINFKMLEPNRRSSQKGKTGQHWSIHLHMIWNLNLDHLFFALGTKVIQVNYMLHLQKSIPNLSTSHNCNQTRSQGRHVILHDCKWEHIILVTMKSEILCKCVPVIFKYLWNAKNWPFAYSRELFFLRKGFLTL